MGVRHVVRYGRHPQEETMKYIVLASFLMTACAHTVAPDSKQCCERLSLHHKQMSTFNRYCKVALFLSKSSHKSVGKVVQKNAEAAVKVCKFVFSVETDDELVAAGDEQEYYRVRSYIIKPDELDNGWRKTLPCDPAEYACEEF
jgi:hypothetical protein